MKTAPHKMGFIRTATVTSSRKSNGEPHTVWRVKCSKCEAAAENDRRAYVDGEELAQPLRATGWKLAEGAPPLCPKCRPSRGASVTAEIIQLPTESFFQKKEEEQMNLKLQRAVIEALGEFFDEKNGRYINAWSDTKVAEKTGAAQPFVTEIRKAAFGELVEDVELTELRSAIEDAGKRIEHHRASLDKELQEIRRRFESYVQAKRLKTVA